MIPKNKNLKILTATTAITGMLILCLCLPQKSDGNQTLAKLQNQSQNQCCPCPNHSYLNNCCLDSKPEAFEASKASKRTKDNNHCGKTQCNSDRCQSNSNTTASPTLTPLITENSDQSLNDTFHNYRNFFDLKENFPILSQKPEVPPPR